jgi:hypothetical protein
MSFDEVTAEFLIADTISGSGEDRRGRGRAA